MLIEILGLVTGALDAKLCKQQIKSPVQHLSPGELSLLQKLPLAHIDGAVAGDSLWGGRDLQLPESLR